MTVDPEPGTRLELHERAWLSDYEVATVGFPEAIESYGELFGHLFARVADGSHWYRTRGVRGMGWTRFDADAWPLFLQTLRRAHGMDVDRAAKWDRWRKSSASVQAAYVPEWAKPLE